MNHDYQSDLSPWVDIVVESDSLIPNLSGKLQDFVKDFNVEILKVRHKTSHFSLNEQTENLELDDLEPIDVFRKKCESAGRPPNDVEELISTFKELEAWMRDR